MTTPREKIEAFNREHPAQLASQSLKVTTNYHGVDVVDPHMLLERNSKVKRSWLKSQAERVGTLLEGAENLESRKQYLTSLMDFRRESARIRAGGVDFFSKNDGRAAQSSIIVKDDQGERVLIDPLEFNPKGTASVQGFHPSPDGTKLIYLLCESGQDKAELRVRDVATGKDLPDKVEEFRWYKHQIVWDDDNKGFRYLDWEQHGGWRVVLRHHEIGTPTKDDTKLLDLNIPGMRLKLHDVRDEFGVPSEHEFVTISRHLSWKDNGMYSRERGSSDAFDQLVDDGKSVYLPLAMVKDRLFFITTEGAEWGKLMSMDVDHPQPENWQTIIPERPGHKLLHMMLHQDKLLVIGSHEAGSELSVFDQSGKHLHDAPLPHPCSMTIGTLDTQKSYIPMVISQYSEQAKHYRYEIEDNTLDCRSTKGKLDVDGLITERVYATSKDGTKVPMNIVRHKDAKLDGSAAVLMTGYGGFNIPRTPSLGYQAHEWLKAGGIYVETNLRGGGEFDKDWYDQGRLQNKQNVFDDFAACAKELIDLKYTSPERLAITGGSNGGLLTLVTSQQRPELFGAVISDAPVANMLVENWPGDYGTPSKSKEDFDTVMAYCPYHNVKSDVAYPPTLVMTGDHDTRVVPEEHAYKIVAERNRTAPDSVCMLYVTPDSGHSNGKSTEQTVSQIAVALSFCEQAMGPIDQNRYKAAMAEAGEGKWAKRVRKAQAEQPQPELA